VIYGRRKVTTDARGVAKVTSGSARLSLRAVRGKDVASNRAGVCVAKVLSDCSRVAATLVNGTNGHDRLKGGGGPETIEAHGGRDRINVRGGGLDIVHCGRGVDRAEISGKDRAARDCEFVNGKKRPTRSASPN